MSVDWTAVRAEYEQGASLRALAARYDVSKSTIARRKHEEQWIEPSRVNDTIKGAITKMLGHGTVGHPPLPVPFPVSDDAATIARIGLHQLAQHLQTDEILPISSHKSLSDALAQYVKVLIVAPRETEAQDVLSVPLNKISPRTRLAIQRLLDEDAEAQEQEQVS
jgi:hypothetical protein